MHSGSTETSFAKRENMRNSSNYERDDTKLLRNISFLFRVLSQLWRSEEARATNPTNREVQENDDVANAAL